MSLPKDIPMNKPRKRKTPKANLEGPVVRECLKFLRAHPAVIHAERRNTGALRIEGGGFVRFGFKGAADIFCLIRCWCRKFSPGYGWDCEGDIDGSCEGNCHTHLEIECKRADGKGRLSVDQKAFKKMCDEHHVPYIVATSVADVEKELARILP